MADVRYENHGSVIGFTPLSEDAKLFFKDELGTESWQWIGPTLFVDHRVAINLFDFLTDNGYSIE